MMYPYEDQSRAMSIHMLIMLKAQALSGKPSTRNRTRQTFLLKEQDSSAQKALEKTNKSDLSNPHFPVVDLAHKSVEDGHVLSKRTVLFLFFGGGVTFCFRCFGFFIGCNAFKSGWRYGRGPRSVKHHGVPECEREREAKQEMRCAMPPMNAASLCSSQVCIDEMLFYFFPSSLLPSFSLSLSLA